MPQTGVELGGPAGATRIHLAPANSFPPQTYLPMLRALTDRYRAVSFPPRALWGDAEPPQELQGWQVLADDLLRAFDKRDMRDLVLVGHSFGAIASLLAAIKAPERCAALVLLDPTILSPQRLQGLKNARENKTLAQTPLIKAAARRRRFFDSKDQAFARFRSRSHFAAWSDETLRLYVEHGLRKRPQRPGYELVWSVEWEIYYYATIYLRIWQELPKLEGLLPLLIMRGGDSDTFERASQEAAQRLLPSATMLTLAGQGHLFPQTAPDETGELIRAWLERLPA